MKKLKKILLVAFVFLFVIGLAGFGFVYSSLNKIYVKDEVVEAIEKTDEDSGEIVEGVTNILLVGTDGKNIEKYNRSDSVMLVTIDSNNNEIKISSIARDTYVDIPGHSTEKLTHAYAYGGIDLLKQVFEVNFDLKIDKYIAVNFVSFMDIMDEIGGVEVNIEDKDINEIKLKNIKWLNLSKDIPINIDIYREILDSLDNFKGNLKEFIEFISIINNYKEEEILATFKNMIIEEIILINLDKELTLSSLMSNFKMES